VVLPVDSSSPTNFDPSLDESEQLRLQFAQIGEETYQFVMGAVHDLRAEQRGVTLSAELLRDMLGDSLPAEARPILARLLGSAAKTTAILDAAACYGTALPAARYSFHAVNASSVVRDAVARLEPEIRKSGGTVTYNELPEVWADRDRLQELFSRLIDNGLKYRNQAPPRVEIEAQEGPKRRPREFLFSVRDYGIGIEPKYQRELFRPFRRLHGPEIPGLGLGLVICRRIAESHGGRLWVESDAGSGTRVFFTLPVPA
jgi:two-component system, chemotaxis family, sensor kinase Cph1